MSRPPECPAESISPESASRVQLLSNDRYTVMLNSAGGGFSHWKELALTRWREDPVSDPWGTFLLLRDEDSGEVWSASGQPVGPDDAEADDTFSAGVAVFCGEHQQLQSRLEIAVGADEDIELRRLQLSNHGKHPRTLAVTSYVELVLGAAGADSGHPAFSKMFVQTEWEPGRALLLANRRRRSADEPTAWMAQALQVEGEAAGSACGYETDRAAFLGRGRTLQDAQAMEAGVALGRHTGCVLDPIFSLRRTVTVAPGSTITLLLWTQVADSREGAARLAAQLDRPDAAQDLLAGAASYAEAQQYRHGIDAELAARMSRWAHALLYANPRFRASPEQLARGAGGPPTLWGKGISGDRPIILLRLRGPDELATVHDVLRAQRAWQEMHLGIDVVLLDGSGGADRAAVKAALEPLVQGQQKALDHVDSTPKVELFVLRDDEIDDTLRDGLLTVARIVFERENREGAAAAAKPWHTRPSTKPLLADLPASDLDHAVPALEFANDRGGFVDNGRTYRIALDDDKHTPQPWINVIANPGFGFIVSAEGGGYSWSINSQQNPLTPWPNDPVSDTPHDVIYLHDEESGDLWSATALPIRVPGASYITTHGKGWSQFCNDAHGIAVELTQCVPVDDPLKLSRLRLSNHSTRTRHLSITGYVEWALGPNGSTPAPFVVTARDEKTGALLARNRWRADFGDRVSVFDLGGQQQSLTGDRRGFLGTDGRVESPQALRNKQPLDGCVGAGLNPCGALQARVELPPHTQIELVFLLGDTDSDKAAQALIEKYRGVDVDSVLADLSAQWDDVLDTVQVATPDRAMDIMLNDWLLYQVAVCRLWARTAYYQSSGAFGFRDQLQDVMALCVSRPDLAREHVLRAAGRQFAEGDVQHWWLPPKGQGIRTKIRDDRIWLAYVTMHYVNVSGDTAVLDEKLPFLKGESIAEGKNDAFFQPEISDEKVSLYEHCALAIDTSLTRGEHGLPLIGTGDWNDGMNAVGELGRGESSWLGWFLLCAIDAMTPAADARGDKRVAKWREYAKSLREALEKSWDGQWYRRGYYDDGTPLGSKDSEQCRIDTIAQSWSVMAGANSRDHMVEAMSSVDRLLVDHEHQIACLFTPPFEPDGRKDPGYIKGYPPGVRENGGQYTHGAIWSIYAWAGLGDGERVAGLFDLFNPIHHSSDADAVERYKVEPYVVSADVYSVAPHVGRGGWTWYTGSGAWLYRAGLEAVLGFQLQGDRLRIEPCIPKDWPGFELCYRRRGKDETITSYAIEVTNPDQVCRGVKAIELDGQALDPGDAVTLLDDGEEHTLRVVLGTVAIP